MLKNSTLAEAFFRYWTVFLTDGIYFFISKRWSNSITEMNYLRRSIWEDNESGYIFGVKCINNFRIFQKIVYASPSWALCLVFLDASEHAIAITKDQADSKTFTFFYQLCTKIYKKNKSKIVYGHTLFQLFYYDVKINSLI